MKAEEAKAIATASIARGALVVPDPKRAPPILWTEEMRKQSSITARKVWAERKRVGLARRLDGLLIVSPA